MRSLCFNIFRRHFTTSTSPSIKICIVGSGPAGFYAAQHLVKTLKPVEVDIYEQLPVPFGLVRFGVAPDHPEVKNVINTFTKTAENPSVRFIGNVKLGQGISLKQLKEAYNVILLTYGAEQNRKLDIPGEDLSNVLPARRIVGWYNGVPEDTNLKIDLSGPSVAIVGQGNVAIDVARILLTPISILKTTDITKHALEAVSTSKIKEVNLIGRRGPLQAAFTIKELREMLKLQDCKTCWNSSDFQGVGEVVPNLPRPRKRITELMLKSLSEAHSDVKKSKIFKPTFFKSPLEIVGSNNFVRSMALGINELRDDKAILTDRRENLDCDLVVTSIGYKSVQADPDIPFDNNKGTVKNKFGKIDDGLYSTGWLATGPTGVILTTMNNAFTTADLICQDLKKMNPENKPGFEIIKQNLKEKNIQSVMWKDWLKIDAYEQNEGKKSGKPREKLLDIKKMLEIAA